jgi:hypothetical protein
MLSEADPKDSGWLRSVYSPIPTVSPIEQDPKVRLDRSLPVSSTSSGVPMSATSAKSVAFPLRGYRPTTETLV